MQEFKRWFHRFGSPPWFYQFAGRLAPWLWVGCLLLTTWGLWLGLFSSPPDYQQGESVRIMYVHVPAAWMSMMIYALMAAFGFVALVWHVRIAEVLAMCSAPIGAAFTLVALVSGSLWGRPTWGTYWVWDARLTSELLLLFLYFGVMSLQHAYDEPRKAARAASLLAIVGLVNLPIIHFSVNWWNTLHQPSSIGMGTSSIHPSMLWPLLIMAVAAKLYYGASLLDRARLQLLLQDRRKRWVAELFTGQHKGGSA